jgi:kumamolisin
LRKEELAGSHLAAPEGARMSGEVDPDSMLTVTLYFKRRSARPVAGSEADLAALMRPVSRHALDAARRRSHRRAAERIVRFAEANGIAVGDIDLTRRQLKLTAPAGRLAELFDVSHNLYDDGNHEFRARRGSLSVPQAIAPWTRAVLGFDQRPQVRSLAAGDGDKGLWPTEVARLYGIPLDHDVTSQCAAIIALGGGYQSSDLATALGRMGRAPPTVVDQSVLGATNQWGGGTRHDEEIALDLQVLAGLLPGARIVVYFTRNNIQGLAEAIHDAVFDETNRPQVLSISWGSPEKYWTDPGREAVQSALADAVKRRVTVVAAAGDELATAGVADGKAHVWFPASCPYVLGCGGTAVTLGGTGIAGETVWNDGGGNGTGGGISDVYAVPAYQAAVQVPPSVSSGALGRGVPDIAALAAGTPGYRIVLGGTEVVKDGTSAATPLWAALIAIANAERGAPIGLVHPHLYGAPGLLRSITTGNNRVDGIGYAATGGWNACTGLGVPRGAAIVDALKAAQVVG